MDAGDPMETMTPETALERLLEGNRRFSSGKAIRPEKSAHERRAQIQAQAPFAAVLGCSDSRVPVEIVFDQGLGDLFIVRVAGSVASPGALASLEFAVDALPCRLVMVLGHLGCGAVQAALGLPAGAGEVHPGWAGAGEVQLPHLLHGIRAGLDALPGATPQELPPAVKANVRAQVTRVRENPVIARAMGDGRVKVVGATYDLESSRVELV